MKRVFITVLIDNQKSLQGNRKMYYLSTSQHERVPGYRGNEITCKKTILLVPDDAFEAIAQMEQLLMFILKLDKKTTINTSYIAQVVYAFFLELMPGKKDINDFPAIERRIFKFALACIRMPSSTYLVVDFDK